MGESMDLLEMFDDLENTASEETLIIKAPFCWPGGKSRSLKYILPHLPHRKVYCEPFGGSGAVLLAKQPSKLEVYNDRYGGVVDFYRCLRGPLYNKLIEWLDLTVNSREEWMFCRDNWKNVDDPVERAGRWYYLHEYSFASKGMVWGRAMGGNYTGINGKIHIKLQNFHAIHNRLKRVQVENLDAIECMHQYDTPHTVFYVDPPYIDAYSGIYHCRINHDYHRRLIDTIFQMRGFVAVSGYANPLYDTQDWDNVFEWEVRVSLKGVKGTKKNHLEGKDLKREKATEKLWIKEVR